MNYILRGFCLNISQYPKDKTLESRIIAAVQIEFPLFKIKPFTTPCCGLFWQLPTSEEMELKRFSFENPNAVFRTERDFLFWSKNFMEQKFVYIFKEFYGGFSEYSGYVFQNGRVLKNVELGDTSLKILLREIGIPVKNGRELEVLSI
jgi:hypothetical protein